MNYIILDMEWNQATDRSKVVTSPVPLSGEIIQIGAVKADESFNYIDSLKINVAPKYYRKMNRHVEKITGITQQQLARGEPFPAAYRRLLEWCGSEFSFITWGNDDIPILRDNVLLHGLEQLKWEYINLQLIYKSQIDGERTQWSLSDAMERLEIPADAEAHDAMNDAAFTFEICKKLDMARGIAEYSGMKGKARIPLCADTFTGLSDCRGSLNDERICSAVCPECGSDLSMREWLIFGAGRRSNIGSCGQHGGFLVKIACKQISENSFTAVRTLYTADESAEESYNKKLERQRAALARRRGREKKNDKDGNV